MDLDYNSIQGLSTELKVKLSRTRPKNMLQASNIDGITPAALMLVMAKIKFLGKAASAWATEDYCPDLMFHVKHIQG